MGQKIHPIGFRLGINQSHQSQWFVQKSTYPNLIFEDNFLRNAVFKQFPIGLISRIEIKRRLDDQIKLMIYSFKPNLILNHYNNDLTNLSLELLRKIQNFRKTHFLQNQLNFQKKYSENPQIIIQIFEVVSSEISANLIADFIAEQLQKRVTFRRAVKKALQRAQKTKNKGIKIQISGRLNGAEIARSEWSRNGRIPLQTLRAPIDYCFKEAKTIYGILGIKVWILKNLSLKDYVGTQKNKIS